MLGWGSTSSGFVCWRSTYIGSRCVLKSPCSLLWLGDASYVGCTALHLMANVRFEPVRSCPRKYRTKSLSWICSGLFRKPHPLFCWSMVIQVASMSNGDSISFLSCVLIFYESANNFAQSIILSIHFNRSRHVNSFSSVVLFFKSTRSFSIFARSISLFLFSIFLIS